MSIITDKSIIKYKPADKEYFVSVADAPCLALRVYPNGRRVWVYRYRHDTTNKLIKITLGEYPALSLSLAKDQQKHYHSLRQQGIDPNQWQKDENQAKQTALANRFALVCQAWAQTQTWQDSTRKRRTALLNLMIQRFGDTPMNEISTQALMDFLKDIEQSHRQRKDPTKPSQTASRVRGYLIDIFAWAQLRGYCDNNPAQTIANAKTEHSITKIQYGNRPAITKQKEFGAMLAKIQTANLTPATYHNLMLLAYLCVRNGDIRHMRWADIDFNNRCWYLTPIKGQSQSKIKMVEKMTVPLSSQAIAILQTQHKHTGQYTYVFHTDNGIISENTAGSALNRLGYQDIHCPHGFRSSAKTLLMQELDYNHVITEMVLGHLVSTGNREDVYMRADLYQQRCELMQRWADYIDDLTNGKDTSHYKGIYRQPPQEIINALIAMIGKDGIQALLNTA